jgi:hypothetical protein
MRKSRKPTPAEREQIDPWVITFTAHLTEGGTVSWPYECGFFSTDHMTSARGVATMMKLGLYGVAVGDTLYPAHRIARITWEVT